MATKSLYNACDKAYDGLTREYPWMGGAVIVREHDGYEAIPGLVLTDISYTGSRDIVIIWDSIYDVPGYNSEFPKDDVVDYMESMAREALGDE